MSWFSTNPYLHSLNCHICVLGCLCGAAHTASGFELFTTKDGVAQRAFPISSLANN